MKGFKKIISIVAAMALLVNTVAFATVVSDSIDPATNAATQFVYEDFNDIGDAAFGEWNTSAASAKTYPNSFFVSASADLNYASLGSQADKFYAFKAKTDGTVGYAALPQYGAMNAAYSNKDKFLEIDDWENFAGTFVVSYDYLTSRNTSPADGSFIKYSYNNNAEANITALPRFVYDETSGVCKVYVVSHGTVYWSTAKATTDSGVTTAADEWVNVSVAVTKRAACNGDAHDEYEVRYFINGKLVKIGANDHVSYKLHATDSSRNYMACVALKNVTEENRHGINIRMQENGGNGVSGIDNFLMRVYGDTEVTSEFDDINEKITFNFTNDAITSSNASDYVKRGIIDRNSVVVSAANIVTGAPVDCSYRFLEDDDRSGIWNVGQEGETAKTAAKGSWKIEVSFNEALPNDPVVVSLSAKDVMGTEINESCATSDVTMLPWMVGTDTYYYELSEGNTVLELWGSGALPGKTQNVPWKAYKDSIKKVIINEGITAVGNRTFNPSTANDIVGANLEEVVLPSTVTSLGECAFQSQSNLKKINLNYVTNVGLGALYGTGLGKGNTTLTISANITNIGHQAFCNIGGVTKIVFETTDVACNVGMGAFRANTGLAEVEVRRPLTMTVDNGLNGLGVFNNCVDGAKFYFYTDLPTNLTTCNLIGPNSAEDSNPSAVNLTAVSVSELDNEVKTALQGQGFANFKTFAQIEAEEIASRYRIMSDAAVSNTQKTTVAKKFLFNDFSGMLTSGYTSVRAEMEPGYKAAANLSGIQVGKVSDGGDSYLGIKIAEKDTENGKAQNVIEQSNQTAGAERLDYLFNPDGGWDSFEGTFYASYDYKLSGSGTDAQWHSPKVYLTHNFDNTATMLGVMPILTWNANGGLVAQGAASYPQDNNDDSDGVQNEAGADGRVTNPTNDYARLSVNLDAQLGDWVNVAATVTRKADGTYYIRHYVNGQLIAGSIKYNNVDVPMIAQMRFDPDSTSGDTKAVTTNIANYQYLEQKSVSAYEGIGLMVSMNNKVYSTPGDGIDNIRFGVLAKDEKTLPYSANMVEETARVPFYASNALLDFKSGAILDKALTSPTDLSGATLSIKKYAENDVFFTSGTEYRGATLTTKQSNRMLGGDFLTISRLPEDLGNDVLEVEVIGAKDLYDGEIANNKVVLYNSGNPNRILKISAYDAFGNIINPEKVGSDIFFNKAVNKVEVVTTDDDGLTMTALGKTATAKNGRYVFDLNDAVLAAEGTYSIGEYTFKTGKQWIDTKAEFDIDGNVTVGYGNTYTGGTFKIVNEILDIDTAIAYTSVDDISIENNKKGVSAQLAKPTATGAGSNLEEYACIINIGLFGGATEDKSRLAILRLFDAENKTTIDGNAAYADSLVVLTNPSGDIIYAKSVENSGKFSLPINLTDRPAGEYTAYLIERDGTYKWTKNFAPIGSTAVTDALTKVQNAADEIAMYELIENINGTDADVKINLELDYQLYEDLDADGKKAVAAALYREKTEVTSSKAKFAAAFRQYTIMQGIIDNEITSIEEYTQDIPIIDSGKLKALYENSTVDSSDASYVAPEKKAVWRTDLDANLKNNLSTILTLADFDEAITASMIFAIVKNPSGSTPGLKTVLDSFYTELGLSSLPTSYAVSQVSGKTYTGFDMVGTEGVAGHLGADLKIYAAQDPNLKPDGGDDGYVGGGNSTSKDINVGISDGIANTPAPEVQPVYSFPDMKDAAWADDAVLALVRRGVLSGKSENSFDPNNNVTREEFAKMIVLLTGAKEYTEDAGIFEFMDVDIDEWYYPYVRSAFMNGFVNGMSKSQFGTGMDITREDLCVIVYNALVKSGIIEASEGKEPNFTDKNDFSDYSINAVGAMVDMKLLNGYNDGTFKPKATATRAEAAVILHRLIENGYIK